MTPGKPPDDPDFDDSDLFGIDLGHRGERPEEASREEVEKPPPPARAARTLTDRLASAKADREDDRRSRAQDDDTNDDTNDDADPDE